MGVFDGIITASFKQLYVDAIDALLETTALTLPCQLIFTNTTFEECPNCLFDSMANRSSNIYQTNGPIPFNQGVCPYCHGIGLVATNNTTDLSLMVIWNYKDWIGWNKVSDDTMTPFGQMQTLSVMSTIADIKNAQEIIVDTDIVTHVKHRFQRISEPNPIGLGDSTYIATMWKRIG